MAANGRCGGPAEWEDSDVRSNGVAAGVLVLLAMWIYFALKMLLLI
ncbi:MULTISPECIES: hypothetical protein [unclassified Bradyrhizobium]|nr:MULTISPECIES: hypothetical protein [unclassified Bradyrhizobium]MCK1711835.1 hypothetical protein [Bradyrhizobium sp. 143]MCK1730872.1 hypothetical protein [Bradyrhizobium sp. 142]